MNPARKAGFFVLYVADERDCVVGLNPSVLYLVTRSGELPQAGHLQGDFLFYVNPAQP
jgi:hypothetical protein